MTKINEDFYGSIFMDVFRNTQLMINTGSDYTVIRG